MKIEMIHSKRIRERSANLKKDRHSESKIPFGAVTGEIKNSEVKDRRG